MNDALYEIRADAREEYRKAGEPIPAGLELESGPAPATDREINELKRHLVVVEWGRDNALRKLTNVRGIVREFAKLDISGIDDETVHELRRILYKLQDALG